MALASNRWHKQHGAWHDAAHGHRIVQGTGYHPPPPSWCQTLGSTCEGASQRSIERGWREVSDHLRSDFNRSLHADVFCNHRGTGGQVVEAGLIGISDL